MTSRTLKQRADTVVVTYEGWQVWDGQYWPVQVGGRLVASVEFHQRSEVEPARLGDVPHIEHIDSNTYRACARVLSTSDEAVVLDLGFFRAVRWIRPGEDAGDFSEGAVVSLNLSLNLNAWPRSEWTNRAASQYGTKHSWHVERIVRVTPGVDDAIDIEAAETTTVESDLQNCLLYVRPNAG